MPGAQATKQAFLADHTFLWLWQHVPPVEALDLLLSELKAGS